MRSLIVVAVALTTLCGVSAPTMAAGLPSSFRSAQSQWVAAGRPSSGRWLEVGEIVSGRMAIDLAASKWLGQGRVDIVQRMNAPSPARKQDFLLITELRFNCTHGTYAVRKTTISEQDGSDPMVHVGDGDAFDIARPDSQLDRLQRFSCR